MRNLTTTSSVLVSRDIQISYSTDGSYYPRMFFVDQNGNIDYTYVNATDGQMYRYFFGKVDVCKDLMKKMLGNATTAAQTN